MPNAKDPPPMEPERWRELISDKDIVPGSIDALRAILSQRQCRAFVWPDEGAFQNDRWEFNDDHRGTFEPLLIDLTSAKAMLLVFDTLNEKNQATFRLRIAEDRGWFATLHEFCWKHVRFGPVTA